ncbi:tRNA dihydrouridine synthase [Candidatus Avelusimicrobium facis]|uniref:tRNA dihydrouridine synthase n=1 Tax=Candidatus Avelusimicrobium facis TaxID=3416203 RepID=UPI003D10C89E
MTAWVHELKIGSFTAPNNLWLAPMAGVTDGPFRALCLRGGAGVVCAEMVSAHAVHYGNARSRRMLQVDAREKPVSMQIFGSDEQTIAEAALAAEACGADVIDINAGCPVKKINKAGAGCVLMKDPVHLGRLVAAAVKAVKVPVTLKTRIALKRGVLLGAEIARVAESEGAAAVAMHARAAEDVHSGEPDLEALAHVCAAVKIPVLGNGGIADGAVAEQFFKAGCAGLLIGRAAVGNPYIFRDIAQALNGQTPAPMGPARRVQIYLELIEENVLRYGEKIGIGRSKKTAGYWLRDFPNAAEVRGRFVRLEQLADIRSLFAGLTF